MLKTMKKSLAFILVLAVCISSFCVTVSAAHDNIPFFFNDYESSFIGVYHGDMSRVVIANGGAGGSAKCLKITDNTASYEDRTIVTTAGGGISGAVVGGSTLQISFYIKITQALSKGNVMFLVTTDSGTIYPIADFDKTNTTGWQKVSVTGTLPNAATRITAIKFRFGSHGTTTDLVDGDTTGIARDFYLDDFTVEVLNSKKADQLSNFDNYYASFDEGVRAPIGLYASGYKNASTTEITDGQNTIQIVNNPAGKGRVVKYGIGANKGGDSSGLMFSDNISTDAYYARWAPAGTVPAKGTATIRFKYYLATEMATDNEPGFSASIGDDAGNQHKYIFEGSDFATTANEWHVATLTYTNSTDAEQILGDYLWVRVCKNYHSNNRTWTAANKAEGETYGARTFYFDDLEMFITADGETVPAVETSAKSSNFVVTGNVAEGNNITFAHTFTPASTSAAGVTDASIVRLMNVTSSGEVASIATANISGTMTVPVTPADSASMYFEVVPMGSDGTIGDVVTYAVPDAPEIEGIIIEKVDGAIKVSTDVELIAAKLIFVNYASNRMTSYDFDTTVDLDAFTEDTYVIPAGFENAKVMLWKDLQDCEPLTAALK